MGRAGRASYAVRAEDDGRDRWDQSRPGRASVAQRQKEVKGVAHGATAHFPYPWGPPAPLDFNVPICVVWVWVEQKTDVLPGEKTNNLSIPTDYIPTDDKPVVG